jgi:hypothetical protein
VADGALRAVRDDELVRGEAVLAEHPLDLELDPLARELLAVEHDSVVRGLGPPQELARRRHRLLRPLLRAADAGQLGLVLDTAALEEDVAVDLEVDACGP